VLSASVFAAMQAPFRAQVDQRAREARALAEQAIAERAASCHRNAELARMQAEAELALERAAAQRKATEQQAAAARLQLDEERATDQRKAEHAAAIETLRHTIARDQAEAEGRQRMRDAELRALEATAERDSLPARQELAQQRAQLDRLLASLEAELKRGRAELVRDEGLLLSEVAMRNADIHRIRSEADAKTELARQLPELARVIGEGVGEVRITQLGTDANPLAHVAAAITTLLDIAQQARRHTKVDEN